MVRQLVLPILIFSMLFMTAPVSRSIPYEHASTQQSSIDQVYRVHNINTGLNYTTIQEAINASETQDGHTIRVDAGIYYENVVVNKSIQLIGENKETTIIDGNGTESVVTLTGKDAVLTGFTIQNSGPGLYSGITTWYAGNMTIKNNIISHNNYGIWLDKSRIINISCNDIKNNIQGIAMEGAFHNTIYGNHIMNNGKGINFIQYASWNTIFHNNFFNNSWHALGGFGSTGNVWDNGYSSGGNCWSDYDGTDLNGDGVGDTLYVIDADNKDRYPLIFPVVWDYSTPIPIVWEGAIHWVSMSVNSTVSMFKFNQPQKEISFKVTDPSDTIGLCNITIPRELLDGYFSVIIDNIPRAYAIYQTDTHTSIYFAYEHTTHNIQILATKVIPEFSSFLILQTFMVATLLAVTVSRRKRSM